MDSPHRNIGSVRGPDSRACRHRHLLVEGGELQEAVQRPADQVDRRRTA